jgi:redox-sensitive bicupin YhaK (pirin superfamily)
MQPSPGDAERPGTNPTPNGVDDGKKVACAGEPKGTPWHPHRGFETITYMLDGILRHQDSNGGGGLITDGDTQWMTAGAG